MGKCGEAERPSFVLLLDSETPLHPCLRIPQGLQQVRVRFVTPVGPPSGLRRGFERFEYAFLLRLEKFHILTDPALQLSTLTEVVQVYLRLRKSLVTDFHSPGYLFGPPP